MNQTKIAVNSMTNAQSFFDDGPYEALQKLKTLGFHSVEISQHIQFDEHTIPEFLRAQQDFALDICALSTGFDGSFPKRMPPLRHNGVPLKAYSVEKDFDELVRYCNMFGCKNIRFAGIPGREFYTFADLVAYMNKAEEMSLRLAEHGIRFCAHNHMNEFVRLERKTVWDWALELAPHLCFELDVMHAQHSGVDPIELMRKCGRRAVLIHIQDLRIKPAKFGDDSTSTDQLFQGVEIGEGNMNLYAICEAAIKADTQYLVVEQGNFYGRNPYESLGISLENLKNYGLQNLFLAQ